MIYVQVKCKKRKKCKKVDRLEIDLARFCASSRLSFDQYGDVTPDFSLSEIDGGAFVRKGVVSF